MLPFRRAGHHSEASFPAEGRWEPRGFRWVSKVAGKVFAI